MQAAKWAELTIFEFDALDMWAQAEIVAGYLLAGRIEEVQTHASRPQTQPGAVDPFANEPSLD